MDALSDLGTFVRPTEFIGQSSGKILKGQTQKVQQAVLEKFRKGGYNVIVATCIGEEGLDIMEVDLVICFDANISPLRMTQRMGRTGRKHDGRVVIIVCEGSEMKGYMRKQATSKAVRKHMRNGGMNSFIFHPSPRMVPHIYRPEQKCLQLSIPEFVPRGKKVNDDSVPVLNFEENLTDAEALTLARYFSHKDNTWKPSLIAYPQFQAYPSRVQMVKHSSRTVTLIDAMQHLQGQSCTSNNPSSDFEYQSHPDHCAAVGGSEKAGSIKEKCVELSNAEFSCNLNTEMLNVPNSPEMALGTPNPASGKDKYVEPASVRKVMDTTPPLQNTSESKEGLGVSNIMSPCRHIFLFSSEIALVDSLGRVLVAPIPTLDVKEILISENPITRSSTLPNCSGQVPAADSKAVSGEAKVLEETTVFVSLSSTVEDGCENLDTMLRSQSPTPRIKPVLKTQEGSCLHETPNAMIHGCPEFLDSSNDDEGELDLSPRLTNFFISGCVPESPINGFFSGSKENNEIIGMESKVHVASCALLVPGSEEAVEDERVRVIGSPCTPVHKAAKSSINPEGSCGGVKEFRTPLANLTNSTCSKDWCMSSGEKSVGAKRSSKLKRLRRIGDTRSCNGVKENQRKFSRIEYMAPVRGKPDIGELETVVDVRDLIQEEAEVSLEADVSADEEDDQNDDTYEDSFIDDRLDPTSATQHQGSEIDMMAIYRRSLLSQSPIRRQKKHSSSVTPDSLASASLDRCSETDNSLRTSQASTKHSNLSSRKLEKIAEEAMPSTSGTIQIDDSTYTQSRKRKYICGQLHVPAINLEKEFLSHDSDQTWNFDMDDEFYESLDFDALEEQAAKLLEEKAGSSEHKPSVSEPIQPKVDMMGFPSFDLGIS